VLYKDEYTSGNDVRIDPSDPNIVYAAMWQQQQGFIRKRLVRRRRWRHLQIHRRRQQLEETDRWTAAIIRSQPRDRAGNPKVIYATGGAGGACARVRDRRMRVAAV
jgi:hypothetical protein